MTNDSEPESMSSYPDRESNSLPRLSIRRPVAVAMFFLAVAILGAISFTRLPIDLLPDVSYPRLVIYTSYPDVGPEEVERFVTERVEAAVSRVGGVEQVESVSRDGVSLVTLRFAWGTDMDFAALNVREKLDNIRGILPTLADRPVVLRTDPTAEPIMALSVVGPGDLWDVKELAEAVFKRRLEQIDGVAQAAVTGGLEPEIQVEVDPARLESYGVTIAQVSQALANANVSAPGGSVLRGRYRYSLRTLGEFQTVEQIADVVIPTSVGGGGQGGSGQSGAGGGTGQATTGGGMLRVSDVAEVRDAFRERESIARYNGEDAVGLLLFKESGANTVQVAERVDDVLEQLRAEFDDVRVDVAMSQAGFISDAISNVVQALVFGGILAFLVLFLFLRDTRYPVAIALAIPISVIGTFALLDAFDVSLNIMSLGGLALGVGMLVDNSIVVLENIFRHREDVEVATGGEETGGAAYAYGAAYAAYAEGAEDMEGAGAALAEDTTAPLEASAPDAAAETAAVGAEEVTGAITASTLTTISVFGPIIYVEGVAGELFGALSIAVAASLLASLLVALTLLPALAGRWTGAPDAAAGRIRRGFSRLGRWSGTRLSAAFAPALDAFDRAFDRFAARYHRVLGSALDHRGRIVAGVFLLLAGAAGLALTQERAVLPVVEQGAFQVRLELPRGTPLERTAETAARLEEELLSDSDVEAVFSRVGRQQAVATLDEEESGIHTALLEVRLAEGGETPEVIERVSEPFERIAAGFVTFQTGQATALGRLLGSSQGADLAVQVRGENMEAMLAYAEGLTRDLQASDGLTNVRLGVEMGQPEIRVAINREQVASYGLETSDVAQAVEAYMRGTEATEFVAFDRRIPVVVRLPESARRSATTLERLRVGDYPLRQLVTTHSGVGPVEVRRSDQNRSIPIYADAVGGLDDGIDAVEAALIQFPAPRGLQVDIGGENEEMRRSFRDLGFAFALAMLLVYMILAAQFESFLHPFTILLSVPLALVGSVLLLWLTGSGLNTMSLIGIVILVGIVVNDAIIKVDFIRQARERGIRRRLAIMEAGDARLRPIVMTTVTTVLGLTPMALGIGRGADLRSPLAIAVIGGLLMATVLTLVVVPVAYDLIEDARVWLRGLLGRPEPASAAGGAGGAAAPVDSAGDGSGRTAPARAGAVRMSEAGGGADA